MSDTGIRMWAAWRARRQVLTSVWDDETGEGVISAAIAVLIMAFLGAAMWVGFKALFDGAQESISTQVKSIGG